MGEPLYLCGCAQKRRIGGGEGLLGHQKADHRFAVLEFPRHALGHGFLKGHFPQAQKLVRVRVGGVLAQSGGQINGDFFIAETGGGVNGGQLLPMGGLREKTRAALRAGVQTVIIPEDNEPDLEEIDQNVRAALQFFPADHADKVLDVALLPAEEAQTPVQQTAPRVQERPQVRQ